MKVVYDPDTDTLTVVLRSAPVSDSDEEQPGLILDFDEEGDLVGLEILDAARRVFLPDGEAVVEIRGLPTRSL